MSPDPFRRPPMVDIPPQVREGWHRRWADGRRWETAETFDDVCELVAQFCEGTIFRTPNHLGPRAPETEEIAAELAHANRKGFLTEGSQPGEDNPSLLYPGVQAQQRAAVSGYAKPATVRQLQRLVAGTRLVLTVHEPLRRRDIWTYRLRAAPTIVGVLAKALVTRHLSAEDEQKLKRSPRYTDSVQVTKAVLPDGTEYEQTDFGYRLTAQEAFEEFGGGPAGEEIADAVRVTIYDPEWGNHRLLWDRLAEPDWDNPAPPAPPVAGLRDPAQLHRLVVAAHEVGHAIAHQLKETPVTHAKVRRAGGDMADDAWTGVPPRADAGAAADAAAWREMEPTGPQPDGDRGYDEQVGDSYSRRWDQPHPEGEGTLRTTITCSAMDDGERRWIRTDTEWQHLGPDGEEEFAEEDSSDSDTDGPAGEPWPTEGDLRAELARINQPPDWDETPLRDVVRATAQADHEAHINEMEIKMPEAGTYGDTNRLLAGLEAPVLRCEQVARACEGSAEQVEQSQARLDQQLRHFDLDQTTLGRVAGMREATTDHKTKAGAVKTATEKLRTLITTALDTHREEHAQLAAAVQAHEHAAKREFYDGGR